MTQPGSNSEGRKRAAEAAQAAHDGSVIVEPIDVAAAIIRLAEAIERLAPDDGKRYGRTLTGEAIRRWNKPPDPPARDWLVPAAQMEALREALEPRGVPGRTFAYDAARDVLDAAREVEHE